MKRRDFLKLSAGTMITAAVEGCVSKQFSKTHAARSRPNIVFVLMDDLGWLDIACFGSPIIKTPTMDRLAKQGCRFTNFYVTSPVCSPSRAGCLTGRIPNRFDMQDVIHTGEYSSSVYHHLPLEEPTYARQLKKAGYRTCHIGKWHLSCVDFPGEPWPDDYGFEHFLICEGGGSGKYENPTDWIRNRKKVEGKLADWSADLYVDEAIKFIESCDNQPFLINLWPWAPHEPIITSPKYKALYADRPEPEQNYFGAITQFDNALGRLITYLEKHKLVENTLIVLTSDNGPEFMAGALIPNGNVMPFGANSRGATPFRDRKHDIYEGGIRLPAIMRWDGVIEAGSVSSVQVSTLDLFPTFCAISGAQLPRDVVFDGGDFRSALKGKPVLRPHLLYWQYNYAEAHKSPFGMGSPQLAIRDGQWKLMCDLKFENIELYNLDIDPAERWNFVKGYPEITQRLLTELHKLFDEVNKPYPSVRYLNSTILEMKTKQGVK